MKLAIEQLSNHLNKTLAPIYLISGDEPLLAQEAADAVRAAARGAGCTERSVWDAGKGFDWDTWLQAGFSQSLFAERQLIELRMPSGKPGDVGSGALVRYASQADDLNVLLIITGKLDKQATNSKWFKALDAKGVFISVWPLTLEQLPAWITRRLRDKGMSATPEAIQVLIERLEGNALACAQEIDKLFLLHGASQLDEAAVSEAVTDAARFDIFGLADTALAGDAARVARILWRLREEATEPVLVLWALSREIRLLTKLAQAAARGESMAPIFAKERVWDKRKPLINKALKRYRAPQWLTLMQAAARADQVCKGQAAGNPWDELLELALTLSGNATIQARG